MRNYLRARNRNTSDKHVTCATSLRVLFLLCLCSALVLPLSPPRGVPPTSVFPKRTDERKFLVCACVRACVRTHTHTLPCSQMRVSLGSKKKRTRTLLTNKCRLILFSVILALLQIGFLWCEHYSSPVAFLLRFCFVFFCRTSGRRKLASYALQLIRPFKYLLIVSFCIFTPIGCTQMVGNIFRNRR